MNRNLGLTPRWLPLKQVGVAFGVPCCFSSIFLFWSLFLIVYMIDILLFSMLLSVSHFRTEHGTSLETL